MKPDVAQRGSNDCSGLVLNPVRQLDRVSAALDTALIKAPRYDIALRFALWEEPPPFASDTYADLYGMAGSDPQWSVVALIAGAQEAGAEARLRWTMAPSIRYKAASRLLQKHAIDESNQVYDYLTLLDLVFPDSVAPSLRQGLNQLSPGYCLGTLITSSKRKYTDTNLLDQLVSINLAELRRVIRQVIQQQSLEAHASGTNLIQALELQKRMLTTTLGHLGQTAELIEVRSESINDEELRLIVCHRLYDFNRRTSEDPIEFAYHQRYGTYP